MKAIDENMISRLHQSRAGFRTLRWDEIYDTEQELIDDMLAVDAFPEGKPEYRLIRGYDYITSFQNRVERGIPLSEKQMIQLKRLASNIAYGKYIQKELR